MAYLRPTVSRLIPAHRATFGYDTMKLATNLHVFPSPKKTNKKIAFLFSHANGFNKETYHPLMKRLKDHLRSLEKYDTTDIHIVAWDGRTHGDSARANEGKFSTDYRWLDHAMDTMAVIDEYKLSSYDQFFGVGHSFGATSIMVSEFFFPKTYSGICVTEPLMESHYIDRKIQDQYPLLKSRNRRAEWPDRVSCYRSLAPRPFWKAFHPEVLENYVRYGLYDTEQGTVKLKCPPEQEYYVFNNNTYATITANRSLKQTTTPINIVYGLGSDFCVPGDEHKIIDLNPKKITVKFVEGSHMVPQENPDIIVPEIMKVVDRASNEDK